MKRKEKNESKFSKRFRMAEVGLARSHSSFRWDRNEDGSYSGIAASRPANIRLEQAPGAAPFSGGTLIVTGADGEDGTDEGTEEERDFWYDYFDLGRDYGKIKKELIGRDGSGVMEKAVAYGGGIRILRQDIFETLISFIVSQNNNIPRIRKCIEALCSRYGEYIGEAFGREWHAFPEPEVLAAASEEDLAALRLGYRAGYIKAAAERYVSDRDCGCLPQTREDILSYRGVGPKVANCIMLFGLRDVGAFPVDTWVKHIMNDMYGFDENDMRGMERFARDKFGELAGYAQQYLFYYYRDSGR